MKRTFIMLVCCAVAACQPRAVVTETKSGLTKEAFDTIIDGKPVSLYILTNAGGMEVTVTNYGGVVVSVMAPDRNGTFGDVVLGFDNIHDYVSIKNNFGAIIGRYGNRIGQARFTLNGTEYLLEANNGPNHLHGGCKGYNTQVWDASQVSPNMLSLKYTSPDMEAGYPGTLSIEVTYTLTDDNELRIDYLATTDKPTIVNLTNHSYFNLKGAGEGLILDHSLTINAPYFTPVSADLIPTGELRPVHDTPFDFTQPHPIGERIDMAYEQLQFGRGYDHNWVLKTQADSTVILAARLHEPSDGRTLEVYTSEPGLQVYTGNFLDGSVTGKNNKVYLFRGAICLETQHFPDSPNKPDFPPVVLNPGEKYRSVCIYKFSAE